MQNSISIEIPADVPSSMKAEYEKNYALATHKTGRLMLFAGDQKIEHLNDDFYGEVNGQAIPQDDHHPEHLFKIAGKANIGVFATQLGLLAHYGSAYPSVPYLVKLNSKSHLVKTSQKDPQSTALWSVADVVKLKKDSGLLIVGVGYTVYVGSEYEDAMMKEAAQVVLQAHQQGLFTVLWMYPRGKAIADEKDPHLIAGAAGVGACLGSDFVKVNYPKPKSGSSAESFKEAILAAGKTKVITAGGSSKGVKEFLQETWDQVHISGCSGNATGRNIHQKPLAEAIALANAMSAITLDGKSVEGAWGVYWQGMGKENEKAMKSK
ncbi:aldolase [Candidatus Woesearchaeota archaeon]|nr:aldolase [Candidatus Woesearchaeota archaeon]